MRAVFRAACIVLTLVLAGLPRPARGMWPLDRHARAPGDTLTSTQWQQRFQTWRERPTGGADSSQALADSLAVIREAAKLGIIDPSRLARLAKQTSGALGPATTTAPPGSGPTAATAGTATTAVDSAAAATDRLGTDRALGAADAGAAGAFGPALEGANADSLRTGSDSTAAVGTASAATTSSGPFGRPATISPPATFADQGFAPSFQAGLTSNNDRMRLTSMLSASLTDRGGTTLSANLGHDQELRLSQDAENESNNIFTALTVPLKRPGITVGVSASSARRNSLGARTTSGRTSDQSENRIASLSAGLSHRFLRGVQLDLSYARNITGDDQTIAATQGSSAGTRSTETTGNAYGGGIVFDRLGWLKLRGRFGSAAISQVFSSSSFDATTSPSSGDTMSVRAELPLARWMPQLTAEFQVRRTEFSYTDVSRTSSGGIQDATKFAVETETRFSRALRVNGAVEPWKFLSANYGVELARDSVSAALRTTMFEDAKRLRWNVATTLRYVSRGHVRLSLEGSRADVNKDNPRSTTQPLNPQTRRDESRTLNGEIQQSFTTTLKLRAYGSVELAQGFYDHAGPAGFGDRDDFRSQVGVDLDGQISSKARARVQTYMRTFDQAFIDPRRSKDSRDETEYVVRQSFDYQITPKALLRQFYGLSSKVVDEIFDPNGDTLNRNHFLQTTLNYQMTSRLVLDGRYDYRLQDNGFYLPKQPRSTARIFAPSARTKTDEIALGLRYALIQGGKLNFISNQVATRDHRTSFFAGRPTGMNVTDRGNLALGLESNIQMGSLKLDAKLTRNQSFNVSLNRAVYYNVVSTFTYAF